MTTRQTKKNQETREPTPPALIAFHVAERGKDKSFWTRIGAAWRHDDGEGLTVILDLMPASGGKIVLRTPKADQAAGGAP